MSKAFMRDLLSPTVLRENISSFDHNIRFSGDIVSTPQYQKNLPSFPLIEPVGPIDHRTLPQSDEQTLQLLETEIEKIGLTIPKTLESKDTKTKTQVLQFIISLTKTQTIQDDYQALQIESTPSIKADSQMDIRPAESNDGHGFLVVTQTLTATKVPTDCQIEVGKIIKQKQFVIDSLGVTSDGYLSRSYHDFLLAQPRTKTASPSKPLSGYWQQQLLDQSCQQLTRKRTQSDPLRAEQILPPNSRRRTQSAPIGTGKLPANPSFPTNQ